MRIKDPVSLGFLIETVRGMGVTLRHLIRHDLATISYPEKRRVYSERYRGLHIHTRKPDGSPNCTSCYMCQTACPAECIEITAGEVDDPAVEKAPVEFKIDMLRCIFCGFCVEACPCEALIMSKRSELGMTDVREQVYNLERLMTRDELGKLEPGDVGFRPYYDASRASGKEILIGPGGKEKFSPALRKLADIEKLKPR
ncbi:MAG: NADH-quinone oxidoreductase subunit I [bacterium]